MTTPPASITVRINGTDHQIDPDQARALRDELCRILGDAPKPAPDVVHWYPPVHVPHIRIEPRDQRVYCGQSVTTTNAKPEDWDVVGLGSGMALP